MVHPPLDIMIEVSLPDQVLDLVLQVPTLFGVVAIFTVKTIVSAPVPFFGPGFDAVRWCMSPFPLIWRKILVHVELRGVIWLKASAVMKWFSLCIILGTMVEGGVCIRDRSRLGGKPVDELCKGFLPSLGDVEERGCRGLRSGVGEEVLPQLPRKLIERNNGRWLETIVPLELAPSRWSEKPDTLARRTSCTMPFVLGRPRRVRQGLYLMREAEESFYSDYLRRMNWGGEPKISEQPPIPVGSQGGLSLVRDPRLGNRRCSRDLRHGRRGGSRGGCFLGHRLGIKFEM
ncbi:hypothetical protein B296_00009021 [Ensete ventricosum]|uniref:Uncharacterized protein n=1 Tax=Ensete ventricosum TaxID=4639 RepID=A0A426YYS1_ENSVE|nr:hypothetical protein B296_00009021 [Ensete ventricosum]